MTGGWVEDEQVIGLDGLEIDVRVGIYDEERSAPQRVRVSLRLYRRGGPRPGSLEDCLDYERVFRHLVTEWPARPHTDLLEQLADDLLDFCLEDARVEAAQVRLEKPDAFAGRAVPSVELRRRRYPGWRL